MGHNSAFHQTLVCVHLYQHKQMS